MDSAAVDLVPLGGLGEIGLNTLLLSSGGTGVLVDCGLMFPEEEHLGVDVVIPDFTHLAECGDALRGVVLTHGHEDHIGALPYFLDRFDVPIHGTPLTLALVREKLRELLDRRERRYLGANIVIDITAGQAPEETMMRMKKALTQYGAI